MILEPGSTHELESANRHRPEIDGLRAVAVLVVLLFHSELGFPGGYVGVDVFFVISGFLITSQIWKDLELDRFSLARFWERRARRILPALLVVGIVTLAAGWFLLLPDDYATLGRSAAAQALFGANIHFWRLTDYFAKPAEQQPLLHTWSLAVEEQFYLIAPLLLLGLSRLPWSRRTAAILGILLLALAGSFASSIHVIARDASAAFYLLPTRAWELLMGAALAFLPANWLVSRQAWRELLCFVGLGLILLPAFVYQKTTAFPGWAALPPCLGAALVIWSNGTSLTTVGKVLATKPVVFVGLISYSLYLWHWPLIAFSRYWALEPLSLAYRAGLLGSAFIVAALSWWFVEKPFRERRVLASRRSFWRFAGAGLAMTLVGSTIIIATSGFPGRFSPEVLLYAEAKNDRAFIRDVTIEDVRDDRLVRFGSTAAGARTEMLVWGDSHAMAALPAFDALFKERAIAGLAATHPATAPVLGFVSEFRAPFGLGREAPRYGEAIIDFVRENQVPDVVLVANWHGYASDAAGDRSAELEAALIATVERLAQSGARPWILLQIPLQGFDVPKALARAAARQSDLSGHGAKPDGSNGLIGFDPRLLDRVVAAGGRIIDPRPRFLDATGQSYVVSSNGSALYVDFHHLSTKGAELMLLPLLRETFASNGFDPPSRDHVEPPT